MSFIFLMDKISSVRFGVMVKPASEKSGLRPLSTTLYSDYLEREVIIDIYKPENISASPAVLFINDGQDLVKMDFASIFFKLMADAEIDDLICVGIHCGAERLQEYGVAYSADYLQRGSKAGLYTKFYFDELLPFVRKFVSVDDFREKSFAGFSLGGLMALDIVWNHACHFTKVGVFSGALWWRRKSYEDGYSDEHDRLMHLQVKNGTFAPWLRFYLQCGTKDETADRNNNGVIDVIDDINDLMKLLQEKGYSPDAMRYVALADGKHNVETWALAFPDFLKWGWGKATLEGSPSAM